MIRSNAFFQRTRRGKVLRVVEQHYLRDDLGVGAMHGKTLQATELANVVSAKGGAQRLLSVLDTNVALNQLDFLESQAAVLGVVLILQTVLEETKKNSLAAYRRLRKLLQDETRAFVFLANDHHAETYINKEPEESPNDYNDRAIRVATEWLQRQMGSSAQVLLLTFDRANRERAIKEGLQAMTLTAFVEKHKPDALDLLAVPEDSGLYAGAGGKGGNATATDTPTEHRPMSELMTGIKAGRLFQGVIRVEKYDWRRCYFTAKGLEGEARVQVLIYGPANVNRAVDGDVVAVEILPRSQWLSTGALARAQDKDDEDSDAEKDADDKGEGYEGVMAEPTAGARVEDVTNVKTIEGPLKPMGRVVGIIKRNWRVYCGVLQASEDRLSGGGGSTSAVFVPVDKKIPKVRIQTRQREALSDKRILVAMDSWPATSRYPVGHYVKTLGPVGDKNIETEVLLHEYNIPWEPFSEKVMACLPPSDWAITPENSQGRRDLRHLPVCSIDPPGCKDIDDALHCVPLPNGNFNVGVHIADVTYFVEAGSALDEEAANRSTSTYLVQKRLDMLPKILTETLCSLTGKAEHFAFSVLWEMTPDAEIVSVDFCKSIMYSVAALSYGEAQVIHDDPKQTDEVAVGIRGLNKLAKKLRAKRMEAGALLLASAEVKFVLDSESQDPLDVQMYQLKETHALVEEFMLLANITVGKKILRHFPTLSVLRRHPAPSRARFDTLIAAAKLRGFDIQVDDSRTLQESLDAAIDEKDPYLNKVIRIMATRCMYPAAYFCSGEVAQEDWHHYGLAAPIYTHFTSPIRRYADVVVHRLLAASIGVAPLPEGLMDKGNLHDLCENMNRRHLAAQMAGRGSTGFHTVLYFKENPTTEEGYVLRVLPNKVVVLVPRFGIEGMIPLGELEDKGQLKYDADRQTLAGPKGTRVTVLDRVKVHIEVEGQAASREAVRYTLVSPPWGGGAVKEENQAKKRKVGK